MAPGVVYHSKLHGVDDPRHHEVDTQEKAGALLSSAFTGIGLLSAVVTFNTPMTSNNYAISIIGEDSRNWQIQSKTVNGFRILTNSAVVLVGNVFWIARLVNDP